eukprot:tig00020912_g15842.t1
MPGCKCPWEGCGEEIEDIDDEDEMAEHLLLEHSHIADALVNRTQRKAKQRARAAEDRALLAESEASRLSSERDKLKTALRNVSDDLVADLRGLFERCCVRGEEPGDIVFSCERLGV